MKVIVFEESKSNADACIEVVKGVTRIEINSDRIYLYDDRKTPIRTLDREYLAKLELV